MNKHSIFVGIPHTGSVKFELMKSLCGTFARDMQQRQLLGGFCSATSPYLPLNANLLVAQFLQTPQAEWLWCLEWDHSVKVEDLYRLVDDDKPIVGGLYFVQLEHGIVPCASQDPDRFDPIRSFDDEKMMLVQSIGMGCTLVHRSVFEKMYNEPHAQMIKPWYWYDMDQSTGPHGEIIRLGHDVAFSRRARAAGFEIWLDARVQIPHLDKGRTLDLKAFMDQPHVKVRDVP